MKIEDVNRALAERGPLRRVDSETWRPDPPEQDSAPQWHPERPDATTWGRTQDEAREMLRRQMCPICGEGPWKSPLNHAAKRHGILKREVREACGLNSVESVVESGLRERFAERGREHGRDMTALARPGEPRKPYRMTDAGRQAIARNLVEWERANPDQAQSARRRAGKAAAKARWS